MGQFKGKPVLASGFEGVAGFSTSICEPDADGGELRYRGVALAELLSGMEFDAVWRWLVQETLDGPVLPHHSVDVSMGEGVEVHAPLRFLQRLILRYEDGDSPGDAEAMVRALAELTTLMADGVALLLRRSGGYDHRESDRDGEPGGGVAARLAHGSGRGYAGHEIAAIDTLLSTMAEHGTTASTFTCRVVASTGASARSCIVAGLSAIGGPRHGGAAADVGEILSEFGSALDGTRVVSEWLRLGRRLPGIGHRVYRRSDPRVPILRELAESLDSPLAAVANSYATIASQALHRANPDREFPPNPDLWIPVVLRALDIPLTLGPAMLTVGRIAGWSAHIVEQVGQGRLLRPSDVYVGAARRSLA